MARQMPWVVALALMSCGRCSERVGLDSSPEPIPELTQAGGDLPNQSPELVRQVRVGSGDSLGQVVLAFDAQGTRLAAAGTWVKTSGAPAKPSNLIVWDVANFDEVYSVTEEHPINAVAFWPNALAFGGGYRATFSIVDLTTKERREVNLTASETAKAKAGPWLARLAVDPAERHLAACVNYTDDVIVWELPMLRPVMRGRQEFECDLLRFSADGSEVTARFSLGRNRTWQVEGGALRRAFADRHFSEFTWSDLSTSGRLLATSTDADPEVALWDTHSGTRVATVSATDAPGPWALLARFHPNGRMLVTSDGTGALKVWRLAPSVSLLATWRADGATSEITELAFSPNGANLAAASSDGRVWVWAWPQAILERDR